MVLNGFGSSVSLRSGIGPRKSNEPGPPADAAEPGRALVAIQPTHPGEMLHAPKTRPAAAFLAHLIATKQHMPQTRHRRRAACREAVNAYELTASTVTAGQQFSRTT